MQKFTGLPVIMGLALGVLSACAPAVPDSAAGIGFGTEDEAMRAREAELAGAPASIERLAPPQALSSESLTPAQAPAPATRTPATTATAASNTGSSADIAAETAAALAASAPASPAGAATPPADTVRTASGLSAENDFTAVSGQRSIQGDAALIAENRSQYQVVEPTAVPERSGGSQPNIVAYALATSHPKGTRVYSRTGINLQGRAERNCRGFASADLAQIEFLSRGGPERDRAGLDPDGDGYACSWDPAPFRKVRGG